MKRNLQFLLLMAAILLPWTMSAQSSLEDYAMRTGTDAAKWYALTSGATTIIDTYADDISYGVFDLGMTFSFCGADYTQFSVNSNGNFRLGSVATTYASYSSPFNSNNSNSNAPKIVGIGRDLGTGSNGYIKYEVFGAAPNRTFVCEYAMGKTYGSTYAGDVKWQIQLCEDGQWRIVYGSVPSSDPTAFQIGACTSSSNVITINPSTHSKASGATMSTYSSWPGAYRYYEFYVPACARPSAIALNSVSESSATLSFTPAGSESSWRVEISPAVNGVSEMDVVNTSFTINGLDANTEYTVGVKAVCGSTELSEARLITFRTECGEMVLPYFNDFNSEVAGSYNSASTSFVFCWNRLADNPGVSAYRYPYVSASSGIDNTNGLYFYQSTSVGNYYADHFLAVMPQVNTTTNPLSSLRLVANYKSASANAMIVVGVMADPADYNTFVGVDTIRPSGGNWINHATYFSNYTGAGSYVAFCHPNGSYNSIYVDDVTLEESPSCLETGIPLLGEIGITSIGAAWIPMGSESAWDLRYRTVPDGPWTTMSGLTDPSCTISGLSPLTTYEVQVRAVCSVSDQSAWSASASATTLCAVEQLPYVADYSNFASCWNLYSGNLNGVLAGTATLVPTAGVWVENTNVWGESHYKVNIYASNCQYWMVTPSIEISANVQLVFDAATTNYNGSNAYFDHQSDDRFVILATADGGNTWNQLMSFGEQVGDYATMASIPSTGASYVIPLTQFLGETIRIAFYGESTVNGADYDLHVHNILVEEIPNCPRPASLSASDVTADAATLTWTVGASETAWELQYRLLSDEDWTSVPGTLSTTSYTLTNLVHSSSYEARVRAYCSAEDQSAWATVVFQTECGAAEMPWHDDLESEIGYCWNLYTGRLNLVMAGTAPLVPSSSSASYNDWDLNGSSVVSGMHLSCNIYGPNANHWIVTPQIHVAGDAVLLFDAAYVAYNSSNPAGEGYDDRFVVLMSTDDCAHWTILRQWGSDDVRDDAALIGFGVTGTTIVVPVNGLTDENVRFAFYCESTVANADNDLHIGNIRVQSASHELYYVITDAGNRKVSVSGSVGDFAVAVDTWPLVTLPSIVENGGVEYMVTGIADEAFLNCSDLVSLAIPSSVNSIGAGAFNNCGGLTIFDLTNIDGFTRTAYGEVKRVVKCTNHGAGQNEIHKMSSTYRVVINDGNYIENDVPKTFVSDNYIYSNDGGSSWRAKNIVLTDGRDEFNTPVEFTAEEVSYTRNFTNGNRSTLYLPFSIAVPSNFEVFEFADFDGNVLRFSPLADGDPIEAYHPYLVGYDLAKTSTTCTFSRLDAVFPATPEPGTPENVVTHGVMTFNGVMVRTQMPDASHYGYQNGYFVQSGGEAYVNPFRCFFKSAGVGNQSILGVDFSDGPVGIDEIESSTMNQMPYSNDVYDLLGRIVRKDADNLRGLPRGVYIWRGKKVLSFE